MKVRVRISLGAWIFVDCKSIALVYRYEKKSVAIKMAQFNE